MQIYVNLESSMSLSLWMKVFNDEHSLISFGKVFHSFAALNAKVRCPNDCFTFGSIRFLLLFRVSLEWTALNRCSFSDMYLGANL